MTNKNIRSSQAISPFGIGQLITFPGDQSVILAGLDKWDFVLKNHEQLHGISSIDRSKLRIIEPRLQKLLDVEYFMKPFPFLSSVNVNRGLHLPSYRFPSWYYCKNQKCGKMSQVSITLNDDRIPCECGYKMIPVRFIAVCSSGHLQDVPFFEWVHNGIQVNGNHTLKYISTGGSGDLGSIQIKCSCGKHRSLAGIMNVNKENGIIYNSPLANIGNMPGGTYSIDSPNDNNPNGQYCKGEKPWLGLEGMNHQIGCGKHLEVLIRGGSNVHYANITSAIFIPEFIERTNPVAASIIQEIGLSKLKKYYEQDENLFILKAILENRPEVLNQLIDLKSLLDDVVKNINENIEVELDNEKNKELDLRKQEHKAYLSGFNSENGHFKALIKSIPNYIDNIILEKYFSRIVLIEKLKETKVFTGFSRISQGNRVNRNELSNSEINWLPATEVFGEGIFLEFKHEQLDVWIKNIGSKFQRLIDNHQNSNFSKGPELRYSNLEPQFIMMHTFAHLFIKRLCFNCGYGSSSLRERIYFSNDDDYKMCGILIYTSSGDTEGSLGGLVRQGTEPYLSKLVKEAIEEARWCSADPVCSEIGQKSGQGTDNINGSACHNCCLLSETSCEVFNGLLDRATIIGTIDDTTYGFFA